MIIRTAPFSLLGFLLQGDVGGFTIYTKPKHRIVIYDAAPPKVPASLLQRHQRNRWWCDLLTWRRLSPAERDAWTRVARLANLRVSGLNLFIHTRSNTNSGTAATLSRRFSIPLHTQPGE